MVELFFALLELVLICYLLVRRPLSAVWAVLILSTTTGFLGRLAFYISGGSSPPLDFVRFATEVGVVLVALKAFFARDIVHNRTTRLFDALFWACLIFFSLTVLNIFFVGPKATIWGWRWTCLPMLMYIVGRAIGSKDRSMLLGDRALIGLLLLQAFYGATQALVGLLPHERFWIANMPEMARDAANVEGGMFIAGKWRFPALTTGHTYFSYLVAFLFLWTLFSPHKQPGLRRLRWLAMFVAVGAVIATGERAGLGMIAAGTLIALALKVRRQFGRGTIVLGVALAGIAALAISQIDLRSIPKTEANVVVVRILELANPLQAETVRWRLQVVWPEALERLAENPLGYGLGSYQTTRDNQAQVATGEGSYFPPHNTYLQIALESGLPGLLLFLILLIRYAGFLLQAAVRHGSPFAARALAVLVAVVAIGMFNPVQPPLTLFFWFSLGLTVSSLARTLPVAAPVVAPSGAMGQAAAD